MSGSTRGEWAGILVLALSPTLPVESLLRLRADYGGGLSPEAGSEILVTTPSPAGDAPPLVRRIPVKSLIDAADPVANLALVGGEEIRVPELGKIYVVGNVKMPGAFAVQDPSGTSLLKMLALAQGLTPYATNEAYTYRLERGTTSKNEIPVDLRKIMDRKAPDVPLMANDVLYIPDNHHRRATMDTVKVVVGLGGVAAAALIYALIMH